MSEADAATKIASLFRQLWRDAEDEGQSLRNLLAGAQEDVCSMTCRSHFPAGHVHSDADHSDKCRAITNALNDTDDVFGGDTCAHCGATALESFDCALNGCRFGLLAEQEDCPTPARDANETAATGSSEGGK